MPVLISIEGVLTWSYGLTFQARADWEQAAQLYQEQGDLKTYQELQEKLQQLEDSN